MKYVTHNYKKCFWASGGVVVLIREELESIISVYLCCYLCRSFVRHTSFVSVRSFSLSCRRSNTRRWPNVGLLLAHRLRRWANVSPVLGYRVVFDATLNAGQRHRRRENINPALASSSSYCMAREVTDKYLGLIFNFNGKSNIAKKFLYNKGPRAMFALLRRGRQLQLPVDIMILLFDTLVKPILSYDSEIWAHEGTEILEKLHLGFCKYIFISKQDNMFKYGIWWSRWIPVNSIRPSKNGYGTTFAKTLRNLKFHTWCTNCYINWTKKMCINRLGWIVLKRFWKIVVFLVTGDELNFIMNCSNFRSYMNQIIKDIIRFGHQLLHLIN